MFEIPDGKQPKMIEGTEKIVRHCKNIREFSSLTLLDIMKVLDSEVRDTEQTYKGS